MKTIEEIINVATELGATCHSEPPMRAVTGLVFTKDQLQKFVHRIVEECIDSVKDEYVKDEDSVYFSGHNSAIADSIISIKQKFNHFDE